MAGLIDNSGYGVGPSDIKAPVGRPPIPGMRWDPKAGKWVWPNERSIMPNDLSSTTMAIEALKRMGG